MTQTQFWGIRRSTDYNEGGALQVISSNANAQSPVQQVEFLNVDSNVTINNLATDWLGLNGTWQQRKQSIYGIEHPDVCMLIKVKVEKNQAGVDAMNRIYREVLGERDYNQAAATGLKKQYVLISQQALPNFVLQHNDSNNTIMPVNTTPIVDDICEILNIPQQAKLEMLNVMKDFSRRSQHLQKTYARNSGDLQLVALSREANTLYSQKYTGSGVFSEH